MLRLTTLGRLDLRTDDDQPVREVLAQPKRLALLVVLALEGRRGPVSRDRLLALFWPDADEARARNALSQALYHLRQALGGDLIENRGASALALRPGALWCDAAAFDEARAAGDLAGALALHGGEFCPGLVVGGEAEADAWLDAERRRLRVAATGAARSLASALLGRGDASAAAGAARRALALQPDDEGDVRALLLLLEQAGDPDGALRAWDEHAHRLRQELELEPDDETRRVADAIRRRRAARADLAPAQSPAAAPASGAPDPPASPLEAAAAPPRRRWPRALAGALLMAGFLAIAVARAGPRAPATASRTVAVLPFVHRGQHFGFLREGLVDLLSAKLDGSAGVRAVDPRAILAATAGGTLPRDESEVRTARRLGAEWYITGDVVEVGGQLQLNGALHAVDGVTRRLAVASVTGDSAALFQLVDDLAGQLLSGLLPGRDTALTRLAAVTTHSLPALKAFLEGERELRAGRDAQAIASFRDAALLDTTFALAQYRLAVVATWVSLPDVPVPTVWASRAARNGRRLTPLARELLDAFRAYREVGDDDPEPRYRALVAGYPDNVEAWTMLGEALFHFTPLAGRSPAESRVSFERALALDPGNPHVLLHLARLAAAEGRVAALDSLAREYIRRFPDADRTLELRVLLASAHDDPAARRAVAHAAGRADPIVRLGALTAALNYAEDVHAAPEFAAVYRSESTDTSVYALMARRVLTVAPLAEGRWDLKAAEELLGPALDVDWLVETEALLAVEPLLPVPRARLAALRERIAARRPYPSLPLNARPPVPGLGAEMQHYLLGLLDLRLGDRPSAAAHAAALDAGASAVRGPAARDLARALRAELAWAAGDARGGLAELERMEGRRPYVTSLLVGHWNARTRFLRAELLHALGRDEEALEAWDSYRHATDLPWAALAHLRQGEVLERRGEGERARFHYGRVLSLWRDCDPELRPLRDRAATGLARLAGGLAVRPGGIIGR